MHSKRLFFICISSALMLSACGDKTGTDTREAVVKPIETAAGAPSPQVDRGKLLYKKCKTCHTLKNGERHKVGPNLYNIAGAPAGQKEGFNYSKKMMTSEIIWTDENLDAYIQSPSKFMPGNRMSFAGIRKAEDRALLIAYMKEETSP